MQKPSPQLLHQQSGPFFLALGGAGEIGANLYIYGCQGYWIAVDCGQGFRSTPGGETQTVVPNIQALEDNGIKIQALLITHSHEDHIGALPWLWKRLNCPVYASPFAAGLIEKRVDLGNSKLQIHLIQPLKPYSFGPFQAEWIPVTHSIPEAHGIYLQAGGRKLYHTGDWKLDPNPVVGHLTAIERLQEIGNNGLDLVIGDSTNAPNPGHSESELQVQEGLHRLISPLPGRVLVTCFASNVARLSSLGTLARKTGRHLTLLGRSMERIHGLAKSLDYLPNFPTLIPPRDIGYLPRHEQMIVCTGSQGEPKAALARLAQGSHRQLELEEGDRVVFSSKTIPGNEEAVERLHAQLKHRGVELLTSDHGLIHASGHPAQDEIRQLYSWLKPKHLLAMHGEYRHQAEHCELAKALDISARVPFEGEIYDLSALPRLAAKVTSGRWLVDNNQLVALKN
ncbi:ribonuclease J [Marinospirillum sp.]|uniref:ribonuclease J n=1 Tax=Marinospirillum sp. TaxID=2183934 RepID=UPI0028705031|nr:ribonuclease J [Marinospirillum sp.]MDR9467281.1 ribonuclease J [Marinospirillum sp.]